jgi:undecaprenyl-diphosphatase
LSPALAVLAFAAGCVLLIAAVLTGGGMLMTHFGVHSGLGHWDDQVNLWFARHRGSSWDRISGDFTLVADTLGIAVVAALATLVVLVRRWGRLAWLLTIGLAVELTVFLVTNYSVERPRPRVSHLGSTPSTSSWPSGHVAATTVLYGGIAILVMVGTSRRMARLTAWALASALVACVGLSRIYRGEHHLTDTLAGLGLGVAALCTAVLVIKVWSTRVDGGARAERPRVLAVSEVATR